MLAITLTTPLSISISPSSALTPIQQILRITAQHFTIPALPVSPIRVGSSEFKDPRPLRWSDAPRRQLHRQRQATSLLN